MWRKSFPSLGIPAMILCPALLIFPGLLPQSHLESTISLKFPPTEQRGATSSTIGGGARRGDSCIEPGVTPLTALMPRDNVVTTAAANPLLFWYVPKTTAKSAEFVLLDDNQNEIYRTTFALASTPGIVYLRPPASTALKVGKTYQWQFALNCPVESLDDDPVIEFIQGQLQRTAVSSELKSKLAQAQPLEQARLYANARIWPETLMIVAQLRSSYATEWQELLESVGLDDTISKAPFVKLRPVPN